MYLLEEILYFETYAIFPSTKYGSIVYLRVFRHAIVLYENIIYFKHFHNMKLLQIDKLVRSPHKNSCTTRSQQVGVII